MELALLILNMGWWLPWFVLRISKAKKRGFREVEVGTFISAEGVWNGRFFLITASSFHLHLVWDSKEREGKYVFKMAAKAAQLNNFHTISVLPGWGWQSPAIHSKFCWPCTRHKAYNRQTVRAIVLPIPTHGHNYVESLKRVSRHSHNFSHGAILVDRNDGGPHWISRKRGLSKSWAILPEDCFSVLISVLLTSCRHLWSVFSIASIGPA